MKTIERQIRNHEFEMQFDPDQEHPLWNVEPIYRIDGVPTHRGDFLAAIALLSAEAPK